MSTKIVRKHVDFASEYGVKFRSVGGDDEGFSVVILPECARLVGVGGAIFDASDNPVATTAELSAMLMPATEVRDATDKTSLSNTARDLRAVRRREMLGGVAYGETVLREYYVELGDGLQGRRMPTVDDSGEELMRLVFHWREVTASALRWFAFYDLEVPC